MKMCAYLLIVITTIIINIGCNKSIKEDQIKHATLNREIVLITDIEKLKNSKDEISLHVDSILTGLLNEDIISTGQKTFDLNFDNNRDISFEIIDLNLFNSNTLPASFDSLAARVIPINVEILDNSTYGYPDAIAYNTTISNSGFWSKKNSVLGTFMNSGNYNGKGEKYLGFRISKNNAYNYGWIKIYCSLHNDTLKIIDFAINQTLNNEIKAGQIE